MQYRFLRKAFIGSLILLVIILDCRLAQAAGFELFGISLDTPIDEIAAIAKKNDYALHADGKIEKEYKFAGALVRPKTFDAVLKMLNLHPKYDEKLFLLFKKADEAYIKKRNAGHFVSFMDDHYLGRLYVTIGKSGEHDEDIGCTFFEFNGKPVMAQMEMRTLNTKILKNIIREFTSRYGKPEFIESNTPDSGKAFSWKKPLTEYEDYIWKLGDEVCKISMKWSGISGYLSIYNVKAINRLTSFVAKTSKAILDGTFKYPEVQKSVEKKENERFRSPVYAEVSPSLYRDYKVDFTEQMHNNFLKQSPNYEFVDGLLNTTWKLIRETLPEEEYKKILASQREWLAEGRDEQAAKCMYVDKDSVKPGEQAIEAYTEVLYQRAKQLSREIFEVPPQGRYENEKGYFFWEAGDDEAAVNLGTINEVSCFGGAGSIRPGWFPVKGFAQQFFVLPTARGIALACPPWSHTRGFDGFYTLAGAAKPSPAGDAPSEPPAPAAELKQSSIDEFEDREIPEYACPDEILATKKADGVYKGIECGDYCYAVFEVGGAHLTLLADEEKVKRELGAEPGKKARLEYELSRFWVPEGGICRTAPVYKSAKPIIKFVQDDSKYDMD